MNKIAPEILISCGKEIGESYISDNSIDRVGLLVKKAESLGMNPNQISRVIEEANRTVNTHYFNIDPMHRHTPIDPKSVFSILDHHDYKTAGLMIDYLAHPEYTEQKEIPLSFEKVGSERITKKRGIDELTKLLKEAEDSTYKTFKDFSYAKEKIIDTIKEANHNGYGNLVWNVCNRIVPDFTEALFKEANVPTSKFVLSKKFDINTNHDFVKIAEVLPIIKKEHKKNLETYNEINSSINTLKKNQWI